MIIASLRPYTAAQHTMQPDRAAIIDAEHAAFMQKGVSISVGACDRHCQPSQVRATGCRVSPDLREISIFVNSAQASPLLADVRDTGAIAVVFNEPSTHRTMQIKGADATVSALTGDELAVVERYRDAFVRELAPLGFGEALIRTLLAYPPENLVALRFTPVAAFSQTPGPRAGEPLRAGE